MGNFKANSEWNYTFDPTNAAGNTKDYIRLRTGDWNGDPQQYLADEMINALMARYPKKFNEACAQAMLAIAVICEQQAIQQEQRSLKVYFSNRAEGLRTDAQNIRNESAPSTQDPPNYGALSGRTKEPDLREYESLLGTSHDNCRRGDGSPFGMG